MRIKFLVFLVAFLALNIQVKAKADESLRVIMAAKDDTVKVNKVLAYAQRFLGNDNDKSAELYRVALKLSERIGFKQGSARINFNLGKIENARINYAAALTYFNNALKLHKETGNARAVGKTWLVMAAAYDYKGDIGNSAKYLLKAINLFEKYQFESELAYAYSNFGTLNHNHEDFKKAILYHKKAIDLSAKLKDTTLLVRAYGMESAALASDLQFGQSFFYASKAIELAKKIRNKAVRGEALVFYADACIDAGKLDEAINASGEAVKYSIESGQSVLYLLSSQSLADAYVRKGDFDRAIELLETIRGKSLESGDYYFIQETDEKLAEAYYSAGNYKKAYHYRGTAQETRNKLMNEKNQKTLAELEVKYQTVQKEKLIADNQLIISKKNLQIEKNRRYVWLSVTAAVAAIAGICLIAVYFRNKRKLHFRQLENLKQEKEIQVLQALMQGEEKERSRISKDLHDGVAGTLAAVKMHISSLPVKSGEIISEGAYWNALRLLDEASVEVRKTAHNLMPEVLMRYGIDTALLRFCNNICNSDALTVEYYSIGTIGRYIDTFELSVYRIVQELLNNTIKHAHASKAVVQLSMVNDLLMISVEDNGTGLIQADNTDGVGLKSLEERISALSGKMEIDTSNRGLCVYIEFETAGLKRSVTIGKTESDLT